MKERRRDRRGAQGEEAASEVEGGLPDLHKASASHMLFRETQRIRICSYHTAVLPLGSAYVLQQTTPHHCSCTTGPLSGKAQEDRNKGLFK